METVSLNGICTIDLVKTMLDTVYKLSQDVGLPISDNASLKTKVSKLHDKVCQPQGSLSSTVGLQANKEIADVLKRPHVGIEPGAMLQFQFLDLRILHHLKKNLLIEELL
jgi:hypothetical protein